MVGMCPGRVHILARPKRLYLLVPRLAEEFRLSHGSGGFGKWLLQLAKT